MFVPVVCASIHFCVVFRKKEPGFLHVFHCFSGFDLYHSLMWQSFKKCNGSGKTVLQVSILSELLVGFLPFFFKANSAYKIEK